MTFAGLLINKNLTVYKLSKDSGVPKLLFLIFLQVNQIF
jgi:hypothetical protein